MCLVIDPTKLSAKVRAWASWLLRSRCLGGGKGCGSAGPTGETQQIRPLAYVYNWRRDSGHI